MDNPFKEIYKVLFELMLETEKQFPNMPEVRWQYFKDVIEERSGERNIHTN